MNKYLQFHDFDEGQNLFSIIEDVLLYCGPRRNAGFYSIVADPLVKPKDDKLKYEYYLT